MNRLLTTYLLLLTAVTTIAQEATFRYMCRTLNKRSLPLVNLTVDLSDMNSNTFTVGKIEIVDYQKRTYSSSKSVKFNCLLRYRGKSSLRYDKKSFAVKLIDNAGNDVDAALFGIRAENSWILDAMAIDPSRMRNRLCFDVWNKISTTPYDTKYNSRNGTEGVFVEVFINEVYHGLYCFTDKIDRKLLDLKKVQTDEPAAGMTTVRGLLYKGEDWTTGWNLLSYNQEATNSTHWNAWELQYPSDYPSQQAWTPLINLINFCRKYTDNTYFKNTWQEYFYPQNLADYVVFTNTLFVRDNGYKNTFLSTQNIKKGNRWLLTPWDMDLSLGLYLQGEHDEQVVDINRYQYTAPFNYLLYDETADFTGLVHSTWEQYAYSVLSPSYILKAMNTYADMFTASGAWNREREKWNGNPVELSHKPDEEVAYMYHWYCENHDYLQSLWPTEKPDDEETDASSKPLERYLYSIDGKKIGRTGTTPHGIVVRKGRKYIVK